jgi:hypothetical protein
MKESLWIVGLDQEGIVNRVRLLRPNRFVTLLGATWLLEISATLPPPPIGSILHPFHTLE